jgi:hypothetical protein
MKRSKNFLLIAMFAISLTVSGCATGGGLATSIAQIDWQATSKYYHDFATGLTPIGLMAVSPAMRGAWFCFAEMTSPAPVRDGTHTNLRSTPAATSSDAV